MKRETLANALIVVVSLAFPVFAIVTGEAFYLTLSARIAILALAGVGLNIVLGLGGLVSFGHAAFFGIGGYVAGILNTHAFNSEPLLLGVPGTDLAVVVWTAAALFGSFFAFLIGTVSLKTSGAYFIMITLAFAQMLFYFTFSWPAYGGEDGLSLFNRNRIPGLDMEDGLTFAFVCFALLFTALFLFSRLRGSRFGAALLTSRQSDVRLSAVGIDPFRVRLVAFVLSGLITALAGALYADLNRFISPATFAWTLSGDLIVIIIIGGVGRLLGPLVGAMLFVALEHYLGGITERWQFFLGLILLCVVLFARGGVMNALAGRAQHG
ncbi:branched-chain amino acid ABC transporter permease [Ensifer sp. ENS05]|uniref:branched-chain amino acid ABC transporter permease n=1 Tax=Ensifer sp. ENS05 TaxID=2769277 RepID=UPI001785E785|nr:branched-chain amino acid ABC transporter permease [Ensifer sp. ENS05]MBD9596876.1 branched-chain amino acid ABC transporter permease [Ensifer sp. ENS05]